jgi:hypothetical protein
MWRLWCKALGEKSSACDKESDLIALIRTVIFLSYLLTNLVIVAGVIRHWNDNYKIEGAAKLYKAYNN